jgi:hypothetical protein
VPQPQALVACVGSTAIDGALYGHWLAVARKAGGTGTEPGLGEAREEVMSFLISSYWVIGEAAHLGVRAAPSQVKRSFDRIRAQQFPHPRAFSRFLRDSGQTVADLLFRVQLSLLSARLQKRVVRGLHSAAARQRALSRFVTGFRERWTVQTVCEPSYVVPDCGKVGSF